MIKMEMSPGEFATRGNCPAKLRGLYPVSITSLWYHLDGPLWLKLSVKPGYTKSEENLESELAILLLCDICVQVIKAIKYPNTTTLP